MDPAGETAIAWIVDRVLERLARGDRIGATALRLLVHDYAATARDDVHDALGPALAEALTAPAGSPESLILIADATAVSDDEQLRDAACDRIDAIVGRWPGAGAVAAAMTTVSAILAAASCLDRADTLARAIDELERLVAGAYEPGEGMSREIGRPHAGRGDLRDHTAAAGALLDAYDRTGRLPYAMLAEELMQVARREWWRDERAGFAASALAAPSRPAADESGAADLFTASCEAAIVLCRLAALRGDPEYRASVPAAPDVEYDRWAGRLLGGLEPVYRPLGADAAAYGLALGRWRALGSAGP